MGFSPQLVDFDGDGDTDLLSGSLFGEIFLFRRGDDGQFAEPEVIENKHGSTQLRRGHGGSSRPFYNSTVYLHDWDGDGDGDLLMGRSTRLLVPNEGTCSQPVFGDPQELQIDGQRIRPGYAPPVVADWDGDGRDDLLAGNGQEVVWYRNTADTGPPVLGPPEVLVTTSESSPFGHRRRHDESLEMPAEPGFPTGICVADFNGDGRPDLLVGDYFGESVEYPEPTEIQRAQMAKANEVSESLRSERQLLGTPPPENETRQQRIERYRQAVYDWQKLQDAYIAARKFETKQYVRHGGVWLYARVVGEDGTP